MNTLVTICARAGSKGAASKNTRHFLGAPICHYTVSALQLFLNRHGNAYGTFDVAVNTDAEQLYAQLDATGLAYMKALRKPSLAGDSASKIDVIRDTLLQAEIQNGIKYDVVLDMDLTSPLRRVEDIKNVIDALLSNSNADVALTVTEARRNPFFNQLVQQEDGFYKTAIASDYVARQQAPTVYDANASLYAYRADFLKNQNIILIKSNIAVAVMQDTAVLDIDSESDYELLQLLAQYFYDSDPAFGEIRDHVKREER